MFDYNPLDIADCDDGDPDEDIQLDIVDVDEKPSDEGGNSEFANKTDQELSDEKEKYMGYLKDIINLRDGGAKLKKRVQSIGDEQERRSKRRREKTGRGKDKARAFVGEADKEHPEILNLTADVGHLRQSASNVQVSNGDRAQVPNGDREGRKVTTWSDDQAGPSIRQGLRSTSKFFDNGNAGQSVFRSFLHDRTECNPPRRELEPSSRPSFKEKTISSRGGALGRRPRRRLRHPQVEGDSPDVEMLSSEDEAETQTIFANKAFNHKKSFEKLSNYVPSMEGLRIAYPSREDLEAVEVVYNDLRRLDPLEFLNDTVIDFYIKYMQRPEVLPEERKAKFYFFNTFFYKKLSDFFRTQTNKKNEPDLSKLRKWTKGTNIFEKEYLIIPIHDKWHWSLVIVCNFVSPSEDSRSQRCILHLDSMNPGHKSNLVFKLVKTYLTAEWKHQGTEGTPPDWMPRSVDDYKQSKPQVPQQENESDCGLFLLYYIDKFIQEAPSAHKLSDLLDNDLFGRNWFPPREASGLRRRMQDLLQRLFEDEAKRPSEVRGPTKNMTNHQEEVQNAETTHSGIGASEAGCSQCGLPQASTSNGSLFPERDLPTASGENDFSSNHPRTAECSEGFLRTSTDRRCEEISCSPSLRGMAEVRSAVNVCDNDAPVEKAKSSASDERDVCRLSNAFDGCSEKDNRNDCEIVVELPIGMDEGRQNEHVSASVVGHDEPLSILRET